MITDEFEIVRSKSAVKRTEDGRLVPRTLPEPDRFGPVQQTADWDVAPISLPEAPAPVLGASIEQYWREIILIGLGVLILLALILAFLTRDQPGTDQSAGENERIESTGELPSDVLPREQTLFGDPDLADGSSEDERSGAIVAGDSSADAQSQDGQADTARTTTTARASGSSTETGPPTTIPTTTSTVPATTAPPPAPANVSLANGGFDAVGVEDGGFSIVGSVPGWISQNGEFEIWHKAKDDVGSVDGDYLLELNANSQGLIYQDFATTPGSTIRWEFSHRGREGRESVEVLLGSSQGSTDFSRVASTGRRWKNYSGKYRVPEGQTITRLTFRSLEPGGSGNLLDAIQVSATKDRGDDDDDD